MNGCASINFTWVILVCTSWRSGPKTPWLAVTGVGEWAAGPFLFMSDQCSMVFTPWALHESLAFLKVISFSFHKITVPSSTGGPYNRDLLLLIKCSTPLIFCQRRYLRHLSLAFLPPLPLHGPTVLFVCLLPFMHLNNVFAHSSLFCL